MKLVPLQYEELAKYLLDLSKLIFASLILKLFEPNAPNFSPQTIIPLIIGLTGSIVFVILGVKILRKAKN